MAGQIRQYDNPIDTLRPSDAGIEAALQGARRSGAYFNEAAEAVSRVGNQAAQNYGSAVKAAGDVVVDYVEHREKSQGAASYAGLNDKLTRQWNDMVKGADPNDPTIAQQFREKVLEPELENFNKSFFSEGGQKWAQSRTESLRNHMFEKTTADMSSLAADAVAVNMKQTANTLSNTAVNDPSSVPHLLQTVDDTVGPIVDSSPYLKGATGSKAKMQLTQDMKQKIVEAGALSAIQKSGNPEAVAQAWAERYPEFLNGANALSLAKAARAQIKFNDAQDRAARIAEKQEQTAAFDKAGAGLVNTLITKDGTIAPAGPDYFKALNRMAMMPGATRSGVEALFNFGQKEAKVEVSQPAVVQDLQTKLVSGTLTPMEIIKANNAKHLSDRDASKLETQRKMVEEHPIKDKTFDAVLDGTKASLMLPTAHSDFLQEFLPEYIQRKAKGELKAGDLNFNDPNSWVSKTMAPYMPTMAQKMQYQVLKNAGIGMDAGGVVTVVNAPTVPGTEGVPANLRPYMGKGLQKSPDGMQWRFEGKTYDKTGKEIK